MIFCVFTQRLVAASTLRTTSSHFILGPNTELSQVEGSILCDRVCDTISLKYHSRGQQSGAAVSTVCTGSLRIPRLPPTVKKHGFEAKWEL